MPEFVSKAKYVPHQKYCSPKCRNKSSNRMWKRKLREHVLEYARKYRQTEKGKQVHRDSVRRSQWERKKKIQLTQTEPLFNETLEEIRKRDNYQCVYCGSQENLTFDHLIPLDGGGWNIIDNLVTSCINCNASKRNEDVERWCNSRGVEIPTVVKELLGKLENQVKNGTLKPNIQGENIDSLYELRSLLRFI